jgi:hypothetical protein
MVIGLQAREFSFFSSPKRPDQPWGPPSMLAAHPPGARGGAVG